MDLNHFKLENKNDHLMKLNESDKRIAAGLIKRFTDTNEDYLAKQVC